MPIIASNVAIIQVRGIQKGESTVSTMEYYPSTGDGDESALEVCQAWLDACKDDWLALVSEKWDMIEVYCSHKIDGVYFDATIPVFSAGLITGDVLPPYNTFSLRKYVDNTAKEPAGERDVGNGRVAISGVGESQQNNGNATAGAVGLANVLGISLNGFALPAAGSIFDMYVQSLPIAPETVEVFAPVTDVLFQRLGTQLTRKR